VPRVIDQQRTDALTAITSAGLKVGEVSRALSFTRAGGTIVGQGLSPGARVEFGTVLAVQEALPRIIWAGPATGLIAGLLEARRRRKKRIPSPAAPDAAKAVPPIEVSARANVHVGETSVSTDDARAIRVELRILPRAGSALQDITADAGNVIASERRIPNAEPTNEG